MAKELGRIAAVGDRVRVSGLVLEADRSDAPRGRVTRILVWADEDLKAAEAAFLGEESTIIDNDDADAKEDNDG